MDNHGNQQAVRQFSQDFSEALSESLSAAAGRPWKLTVVEAEGPPTPAGSPVFFKVLLDGKLHGELLLALDEPQARILATAIRGQRVGEMNSEEAEALRTVIASSTNKFAASLSAEHGAVACNVERVESPVLTDLTVVHLAGEAEDGIRVAMTLHIDRSIVDGLSSASEKKNAPEADTERFDPVNLNLVMDVELSMSLRFGQRRLPLREVLDLVSGSVVELDRQVDDPVELLLDGRVIARGEAVIVDGNYGLRVTEITEPITSSFVR
jgi:flagellar motor switch protein FliN/FliY